MVTPVMKGRWRYVHLTVASYEGKMEAPVFGACQL